MTARAPVSGTSRGWVTSRVIAIWRGPPTVDQVGQYLAAAPAPARIPETPCLELQRIPNPAIPATRPPQRIFLDPHPFICCSSYKRHALYLRPRQERKEHCRTRPVL